MMQAIPPLHGKIYFASDLHLGVPDAATSLVREKKFVRWLDEVSHDAGAIFLLGDLFDFWFEYRQVVPRGFVRVLGKLAELRDRQLPIFFFTGNHDQWMRDYFMLELGIPVYHQPMRVTIDGKKFLLAHGDGLGPGDHGYKFLKKIFRGKISRWLFARLHPNFALWLGKKWSRDNRMINGNDQATFMGEEREWLIQYARQVLKTDTIDFFVFGHRHIVLDYPLNESSRLIHLGDWLRHYSYAVFENGKMELRYFH